LPFAAVVLGLLLLPGFAIASAALAPDDNAARSVALDSVKMLIVRQDYRNANRILSRLMEEYQGDMHVLYQRFTTRQTEILEYESYALHGKQFIRHADTMVAFLEKRLPSLSGSDSLDCLFYLASAYGGRGVMMAKTGAWFGAVREAVKSRALLEELVKADSTYFAAYLGLGVFDYYLSQGMKWLPLFNRTDEGIAAIERASSARFPYNIAAKNVLCWVYMERDRYRAADSVCATVLAEYPDNTVFVKIATCNSLWTHQYAKTIKRATKLVNLASGRRPVNWCDLMTGYRSLVDAYLGSGDSTKAAETAAEACALRVPESYLKINYVEQHLAHIREVHEKLAKKR
jgi:hypothetical protein